MTLNGVMVIILHRYSPVGAAGGRALDQKACLLFDDCDFVSLIIKQTTDHTAQLRASEIIQYAVVRTLTFDLENI